jgi:hypothetical protein
MMTGTRVSSNVLESARELLTSTDKEKAKVTAGAKGESERRK